MTNEMVPSILQPVETSFLNPMSKYRQYNLSRFLLFFVEEIYSVVILK